MHRNVLRYFTGILLIWLYLVYPAAADPPKPLSPLPGDKCPVCGMFVAKYPDWTAQIRFKGQKTVFFDGAKDLFKYYFTIADYFPGKTTFDIAAIFVTDYYSVTFIDAVGAYFVMGSDVFGPMGRELIPLSGASDAEAFLKDHHGKKILGFDAITPALLHSLE
jgi:copper chaperone NosL